MDNLEEFVRKHREEMDRYEAPKSVWRGIREELHGRKTTIYRWLSVAAAAAVIITLSVPLLVRKESGIAAGGTEQFAAGNETTKRQLRETEIYYNNLANSLYSQAGPLLAKYPEVEKELMSDMSQLDSICTEIKKDLKDNVSNQEVIGALIMNYRIRISILEDMLSTLKENEDNPKKSDRHEL